MDKTPLQVAYEALSNHNGVSYPLPDKRRTHFYFEYACRMAQRSFDFSFLATWEKKERLICLTLAFESCIFKPWGKSEVMIPFFERLTFLAVPYLAEHFPKGVSLRLWYAPVFSAEHRGMLYPAYQAAVLADDEALAQRCIEHFEISSQAMPLARSVWDYLEQGFVPDIATSETLLKRAYEEHKFFVDSQAQVEILKAGGKYEDSPVWKELQNRSLC